MTQMITVECSDGTLIDVDKHMAITMSGAIRKRLEDKTFDENTTIVLDNITSNTLLKVLEFCSVHTSPQVPNLKVWDEKFVRLEPGELCELASAAYYLEIKPLVDLTCKAIAKLLKGKPPAEIRRTFNILYDFSPGDDVPPPTIRDKLRTKLHYKQKDRNSRIQEEPEEDTRSVDDLVSFIDGDSNNNNNNNSNNNNNNNNKLTTSTSNNSLSSLTSKKKKTKKPKSLSTSSNNANSNNSNNNNNNNNSNNSSASNSLRTSSGSQSESPITSPKQQRENNNSILRNYEISNISDTKDPQLRPHRESLTSKKNNKGLYSMIFDDMSEDMWASEEDEDLDPELKAAQDREVEEFRKRLESIQTIGSRPKITITGNSNPELKGSKSKLAKV